METFFDLAIERKKGEILIESFINYDHQKLRKAEFDQIEPFEFRVSEGENLFDVIGYQDTSNFAISKKLYNLLRKNKITGWKGYEIYIVGKREKYYGFQVIGKCGPLNMPKKMGFYTGYKFDYDSWDGSDFFSPDGTMLLFCTSRVYELFKKNKITNAELTDVNLVQAYSVGS